MKIENILGPEQEKIIKVAIADDHKIFRKGIILFLRRYANIEFVQEADNGQQLVDHLVESNPDVILMDLKMPVKDGVETTKYVNKHFPSIKILILTMCEDERFVVHLMDNGANGYLLKSTDPAEVRKAIYAVMRTGFYLNNFVNKILSKKDYSKQKFNPNVINEALVSEQEGELLSLVCMEDTAGEIVQKVDNSNDAVEAIKDRLMKRFSIRAIKDWLIRRFGKR